MSITQLPLEVLEIIATGLSGDTRDLCSFCLTSRDMWLAGRSSLWHHLTLSPWGTDGLGCMVLSRRKQALCLHLSEQQKLDHADHDHISQRLSKVTILSVREHPSRWCRLGEHVPLVLPNLKTLHLFATFQPYDGGLLLQYGHHMIPRFERGALDSRGVFVRPPSIPILRPRPCPLLASLRPRTIVLRRLPIVQSRLPESYILDPWDSSSPYPSTAVWEEVETLVLVNPASHVALRDWDRSICNPSLAPNLKQILWIVDPMWIPRSGGGLVDLHLENKGFTRLASIFAHVPITVVNADVVLRYYVIWCGSSLGKIDTILLEQITRHVHGWPTEKRKRRLDSMTFMSLEQYLEHEPWTEVFDQAEMELWRDCMCSVDLPLCAL
ncbi:hypothetical protein IAU59_005172 [Kwoniella sp. CBS 9459]